MTVDFPESVFNYLKGQLRTFDEVNEDIHRIVVPKTAAKFRPFRSYAALLDTKAYVSI